MRTATQLMVLTSVPAKSDSQEMESFVLVRCSLKAYENQNTPVSSDQIS